MPDLCEESPAGPPGLPSPYHTLEQLCSSHDRRRIVYVHFNVISADELREAKADPAAHESLIVRISGYSARFATLREEIQDALIERAGRGI